MKKTASVVMLTFIMVILSACSVLQGIGAETAPAGGAGEPETEVSAETEVTAETEQVDYDELLEDMQQAAVANPWGDTQVLSVAEEYSGVHFDPPEESCLPDGLSLEIYRYMEEIIEARYSGGDNVLIIRKSNTIKGQDLSGDYSRYPAERVVMIQGMAVTCLGDGDLINSAFYDNENGHFSIVCNIGEEGSGLTEAQLKKLIEGESVPDSEEGSEPENVSDSTSYSFRSPELLMSHFTKHGIDMGFTTPEAYEEAASRVVTNPAALHKTEAEDGDDVYYVEDTNEFVVMSRDGFIRTYFNPDRGKAYFDRQ